MARGRLPRIVGLALLLLLPSLGQAAEPREDINRASATDLQKVKGIGPKTAAKIIAHRDEVGGYKRLYEVTQVKGIGEKTYLKIACRFFVPAEGIIPCRTGPGPDPKPVRGQATGGGRQPINLNLADEVELTQLPGIGPKKAEMIIAYRTAHGPFDAVDDLRQIKGFGPKTVARLAPLVAVRVNVNEADAALLERLGFTNVAKILEYRKVVGRFASLKDLAVIPGTDPEVLERVAELLSFE